MIEKTSVCFAVFLSGIKLLDISVQRIKRFIEKRREYRYIQLANVMLTTENL